MDKYEEMAAYENEKPERAWKVAIELLKENPRDAKALIAAPFLAKRLGNGPIAYFIARNAIQTYPNEPFNWLNYGEACRELWLMHESERAYKRGFELARTEQTQLACLLNLSALYLDSGMFAEAEGMIQKILEIDPEHRQAQENLGFCQLARHDWANGWRNWGKITGHHWRPKTVYKGEPEWDGTPGKTVVLYAEQGLGDEISFASMIPDAAKVCKKLIFDCDGRLAGLFQRSFPQVKVYGTRVKEEKWAKEDWEFDASLPVGQVGEFFRRSDGDFPGTPYLVPCPVRLAQWKEVFKDKPTIGIAWTGGKHRTNYRNRRFTLKQLLPILKLPARFVSLQYQDATDEIKTFKAEYPEIYLQEYPWATESFDYDDTAALVAACDYVVCMQTAVAHTAGGLGTPVTVFVPKATSWRYGSDSEKMVWYNSMTVIHQQRDQEWGAEIERVSRQLRTHLAGLPRRAGETAPAGRLRHSLGAIRSNGVGGGEPDGGASPVGLRLR